MSVARLLDHNNANGPYVRATEAQRAKLADPALTPSAQVLATMADQQIPFFRFSMNQGLAHKAHFESLPLSGDELTSFRAGVAASLARQQEIEAADTLSFAEFMEEYLTIPEPSRAATEDGGGSA